MHTPQQAPGLVWYLGTVQYCVCLFVGGALWFLAAWATAFFWADPVTQGAAVLLLLVLIGAEAWWAHLPAPGNPLGDYFVDFVSSAAIAAFGMAVVVAILLWLPQR